MQRNLDTAKSGTVQYGVIKAHHFPNFRIGSDFMCFMVQFA